MLNWRWPFSRQITLSLGTLAVILAVWWTVAALQLISPLFYRRRDRFYKADRHCRAARVYGCHAVAASGGESDAYCYRAAGGSAAGRSGWDRDGLSPTMRGILDPIIELYRPVPPRLFTADGHLVWHR